MKSKLLEKIKRYLTGQVNIDSAPDIGVPIVHTVSKASSQLYEVTGYNNPLNKEV